MSGITGKEPGHWHDGEGRHRMPDPRERYGAQPVPGQPGLFSNPLPRNRWGDPDAVAYAGHLDVHDAVIPERRDGDSDTVRALFEGIENAQQLIRTSGKLINGLRERENGS